MKSYFQRIIWLGFVTAISIIAWLGISSYRNNANSEKTARLISHSNKVLYHAEEILSLTIDLESGQRGFSLTGMEEFLKPTVSASNQLDEHLQRLLELTRDSKSQQERVTKLRMLVEDKVEVTMAIIEVRRQQGFELAKSMNASLAGKKVTDNIRNLIQEIQVEENRLLIERTEQVQYRTSRFNSYFVMMLFSTGVILLLLFYFIYVNLKARAKAETSLRVASDRIQDIYHNAPCGYYSLDDTGTFTEINNTWLEWLKYTRAEVVDKMKFYEILTPEGVAKFHKRFEMFKREGYLRDEMFEVVRKDGTTFPILVNATALYDKDKKFLKTRSTVLDYTEQKNSLEKIEQLNHELESFSYSVSHDLRAPLRSIDGYTQILLEDYTGKLDDEGRRILGVVVNNARRMAKLIDDLLDFSRVGRKELSTSLINMEAMVYSVVSELKSVESGREISIEVSAIPSAEADANLLRQVWVNLISNALKYTRKTTHSSIEISSERGPGEIVYTVKDNGTGFDMQYANKLFGVFQRLHRQNDFEGTGVGLAIVHRIINRHGGRVWAKGEVGKGAVFYFSLPTKDL